MYCILIVSLCDCHTHSLKATWLDLTWIDQSICSVNVTNCDWWLFVIDSHSYSSSATDNAVYLHTQSITSPQGPCQTAHHHHREDQTEERHEMSTSDDDDDEVRMINSQLNQQLTQSTRLLVPDLLPLPSTPRYILNWRVVGRLTYCASEDRYPRARWRIRSKT